MKCRCTGWLSRTCRDNDEGYCECWEPCCNTGWWADDGDGHKDFVSWDCNCTCKRTELT